MIVGLVDNEYPSGSTMSASVIICIVLLGLIPKSKLLGSGWCCGVSPSRQVDSRPSATLGVQRVNAGAARNIGYYT